MIESLLILKLYVAKKNLTKAKPVIKAKGLFASDFAHFHFFGRSMVMRGHSDKTIEFVLAQRKMGGHILLCKWFLKIIYMKRLYDAI